MKDHPMVLAEMLRKIACRIDLMPPRERQVFDKFCRLYDVAPPVRLDLPTFHERKAR